MKSYEKTITASACIFGYFLSLLLLKYVLYDHGFVYSNILLLVGLAYVFFYFLDIAKLEESLTYNRPSEGASLILFVLFDRSLLDIHNIFLILGAACIREQFRKQEESSFPPIKEEIASFICGLIYLLMGWFSAGRILVIYFLIKFYFCTIAYLFGALVVFGLSVFLEQIVEGFKKAGKRKKADVATSNENQA